MTRPLVDCATPGKYTVECTIKSIEPCGSSGKVDWVGFEEISGRKFKCFKRDSARFVAPYAVGAKAEAVIEVSEDKDVQGNPTMLCKLASWGGLKAGSTGGNRGSSAGRDWMPKTREEMHSPSIAGIVKAAIEKGVSVSDARKLAEMGIDVFLAAMDRLENRATVPTLGLRDVLGLSQEFGLTNAAALRLAELDTPPIDQLRADLKAIASHEVDVSAYVLSLRERWVPRDEPRVGAS